MPSQVGPPSSSPDITTMLMNIQSSIEGLGQRVGNLEKGGREGPSLLGQASTTTTGSAPSAAAHTARELEHLGLQSHTYRGPSSSISSSTDDKQVKNRKTKKEGKKSTKSGRAKTTEDFVVNEVHWPHYGVYKGSNLKPADYDSLEVHEFVFGYLDCILRKTKKEAVKLHMLEHLKDLMEDCFTSPWDSIRNLHAILLGEMERGHLSWTEGDKITRLRHKYANIQTRESTTGYNNQHTSSICTLLQTEECNEERNPQTSRE